MSQVGISVFVPNCDLDRIQILLSKRFTLRVNADDPVPPRGGRQDDAIFERV